MNRPTFSLNEFPPLGEFTNPDKPHRLSLPLLDSGYSTVVNSPETEFPPSSLDWDKLSAGLDALLGAISSQSAPIVIKPEGNNYTFNDCTFTIQGWEKKLECSDEGIYEEVEAEVEKLGLNIQVNGPSGQIAPVIIDYNTMTCTFRPVEIGVHRGSVLFEGKHLEGSPFHTTVMRNYKMVTDCGHPVVSMDIEIPCEDKGTKIEVKKPWGIACIQTTEQILVADREHHEVLVFSPDGELEFTFGKLGPGPGEFFRPTSIAHDPKNNRILVSDKDNHRIQIFNNKGEYLSSFGRRGYRVGQFSYPWGLGVSKSGEMIAVADTRNHRVQLFDEQGTFLRQWPLKINKSEFDHPRGIAFDLNGGNIYVSDFNLHCIFKIDINFTTCTKIVDSSFLRRPQGLAVDGAGNLLVTDSRNNCVKVFLPTGEFLQAFDRFSPLLTMDLPLDLSVMPAGFLAVLDLNGRVSII
jgi:tripartite motif-containing protein 71